MPKFKYKYDTIKRVKKIFEKKTQKELLEIIVEINKKMVELKELDNIRQEAKVELSKKNITKVIELKFNEDYDNFMIEKIELVKKEIKDLEQKKIKKMRELAEKSKEHKIFETLKEKHYEEFLLDENKKEQKESDENATINYLRSER